MPDYAITPAPGQAAAPRQSGANAFVVTAADPASAREAAKTAFPDTPASFFDRALVTVAPATLPKPTDRSSLPKWRAALAAMSAGTRDARLLCLGDSTVQGFGAIGTPPGSGWAAGTRQAAWPDRLAKALQDRGVPARAAGFLGAGANPTPGYGVYDPRVVLGGWAVHASLLGMGGRLFTSTAATGAGSQLSFSPGFEATSVDVHYVRNNGLNSLSLKTGGVQRAVLTASEVPYSTLARAKVSFPATSGPIVLETLEAAKDSFVVGMVAYGATRAVSVMNAGWGGSKVADWVQSDQAYRAFGSIPIVAPDLTVICLTINDWNAATDQATYKANLSTLVDQALVTGDVLLMTGAPSAPGGGRASPANQRLFTDAVSAVAAEKGLARPVEAASVLQGSYNGLYNAATMFDELHPNGVSHAVLAEAVAGRIV